MNAPRLRWSLVTAITILAVGCGGTPGRTITAAEAVQRIDGYLQETISSVPTSLRFSGKIDDTSGSSCVRGLGDHFTEQVKPGVVYTATEPPTGDGEGRRFLDAVASYWQGRTASVNWQGRTSLADLRPEDLDIRPYQDKYHLLATYYPTGHKLVLSGWLDDCIWPNGTPQA